MTINLIKQNWIIYIKKNRLNWILLFFIIKIYYYILIKNIKNSAHIIIRFFKLQNFDNGEGVIYPYAPH